MALVLLGINFDSGYNIDTRSVAQKIVDSVIIVNGSSGIVVYSDDQSALVLTAYHVIDDTPKDKIQVYSSSSMSIILDLEIYTVTSVHYNKKFDLALIGIETKHKIHSVDVSKYDIDLGEDVFIAGNPKSAIKTLSKGIVSVPIRIMNGSVFTQVDAGVIFGSSGGGAFNEDGKLVGVVESVRMYKTDYCLEAYDEKDVFIGEECLVLPIPYLGNVTHRVIVLKFLLSSPFSERFNYLK